MVGKELMTKCWHYEDTVKLISKKKSYNTDMVPSHTEQLGPLEMRFCSNPKCQNILLWTKGREMTQMPENREGNETQRKVMIEH